MPVELSRRGFGLQAGRVKDLRAGMPAPLLRLRQPETVCEQLRPRPIRRPGDENVLGVPRGVRDLPGFRLLSDLPTVPVP